MKRLILFIIITTIGLPLSAQRYQKLGHGIQPKMFFHQQNINYYLICTDDNGKTYRIQYDTVSSNFSYGKEFTQIRLSAYDGISWLTTAPVRLFSKNTIDAPRILDMKFFNHAIYICGSFDSSENNMGPGILKYDGNWQSAGAALYQKYPDYFEVNAMHVFGQSLLITGNFDSTTGGMANGLLLNEENTWKTIGNAQDKGFRGLSGTSNVYFLGKDSLYAYNKNKILPDSIEIGGEVIKKLGVFRGGRFWPINYPYPYIAGLGSYQKQLIVMPCSQLLYVSNMILYKNNQWLSFNLPNNDSFYSTNFMGSHEIDNLLYLFFQSPTEGVKIYEFDGQDIKSKGQFKIAESYTNIEFRSQFGAVYISGNFNYISSQNYLDSFNRIVKIDFVPSTRITGICFLDLNGDGVKQTDESVVPGAFVTDKLGNTMVVSDGKGRFNMNVPIANNYLLGSNSNGLESKNAIVLNNTKDSVYFIEIPLSSPLNNDVSVHIYCNTAHRVKLGYKTKYVLELINRGTVNQNFQIKVTHAAGIDQKQFELFTPDLIQKDNWIKQVQLESNSKKSYVFECRYPVDSFTLDSFVNISLVTTLNDYLSKNNADNLDQKVVAAFDPNIKVAIPGYILEKNDVIKYSIHFENLGNDTALNVTVVDTIGSLLDLSHIVISKSSHNYKFRVENNCLIWSFENIKLPPRKHDSVNCNGFVTLSTYVNSDAQIGDTIYNGAAIFFDYQKPVITNKAEVYYDFKKGISRLETENLYIHPNPGKGHFIYNGNTATVGNWTLFDMQGRAILTLALGQEGSFELPDSLDNGLYHLVSENGQLSERIVLIR